MKILKAGTRVTTVIGNIDALVVGVNITQDTMDYKVRWFINGEERVSWLYRFEIYLTPIKQPAGFKAKEPIEPFDTEIFLIDS
jgi:hypothetical protein